MDSRRLGITPGLRRNVKLKAGEPNVPLSGGYTQNLSIHPIPLGAPTAIPDLGRSLASALPQPGETIVVDYDNGVGGRNSITGTVYRVVHRLSTGGAGKTAYVDVYFVVDPTAPDVVHT